MWQFLAFVAGYTAIVAIIVVVASVAEAMDWKKRRKRHRASIPRTTLNIPMPPIKPYQPPEEELRSARIKAVRSKLRFRKVRMMVDLDCSDIRIFYGR